MSDNYEQVDQINYSPYSVKIKVIGVGSGGINAVVGMLICFPEILEYLK
jgi:cell division GTPase FtsZ